MENKNAKNTGVQNHLINLAEITDLVMFVEKIELISIEKDYLEQSIYKMNNNFFRGLNIRE